MPSFNHVETCICCQRSFQFGPSTYEGRHLPGYKMMVCRDCYDANWDGWAPHYEGFILKHLREKGIQPPPRNANGWLPRDWPHVVGGA